MSEHNTDDLALRYVTDDGTWDLKLAKAGDVGYDLPTVINAKDSNHRPKVHPHRDYYVSYTGVDGKLPHVDIPAHGHAELYTGIRVKLPENCWGNIRSRSSTGWKKHLNVYFGTIDTGYVGPLFILIHNPNAEPVRVYEGERLAQLILIPKYTPSVIKVTSLPTTERGDTGFGSSNSTVTGI